MAAPFNSIDFQCPCGERVPIPVHVTSAGIVDGAATYDVHIDSDECDAIVAEHARKHPAGI